MIWIKGRLSGAVLVAAMLALAACGGAGGGAGDGGGGAAQARTVGHAMGETEIEGTPKRVVVLDTGELDSAMSLGVTPVGAVEAVEGLGLPSYLEGTGGIENVGTIEEPNLEKIATLEPDLILSSKLRHEAVYDQLSRIAPTVFTETTGVTWKANFEKHAEAMNRSGGARRIMADYRRRTGEFRETMGDRLEDTEVSVVRFLPGETRIYQKESFAGTVLEDAGLPRPPAQDVDEFALLNVSEEEIPKMDGGRRRLRYRLRRSERLDAGERNLGPALAEARCRQAGPRLRGLRRPLDARHRSHRRGRGRGRPGEAPGRRLVNTGAAGSGRPDPATSGTF